MYQMAEESRNGFTVKASMGLNLLTFRVVDRESEEVLRVLRYEILESEEDVEIPNTRAISECVLDRTTCEALRDWLTRFLK